MARDGTRIALEKIIVRGMSHRILAKIVWDILLFILNIEDKSQRNFAKFICTFFILNILKKSPDKIARNNF